MDVRFKRLQKIRRGEGEEEELLTHIMLAREGEGGRRGRGLDIWLQRSRGEDS